MEKIRRLSDDNMKIAEISIVDKAFDQDRSYPGFLHIEARSEDGSDYDYESIDSINGK